VHADSNFVVLPFNRVGAAVQQGFHSMSRYIHLSLLCIIIMNCLPASLLVSTCLSTNKENQHVHLVFTGIYMDDYSIHSLTHLHPTCPFISWQINLTQLVSLSFRLSSSKHYAKVPRSWQDRNFEIENTSLLNNLSPNINDILLDTNCCQHKNAKTWHLLSFISVGNLLPSHLVCTWCIAFLRRGDNKHI
jgi:hypothetical protein